MTDQSITRRNIGVLTAAQALGGASAPIVMSLGGLVGQQLAKDSAWITLPVSLFGLGLAIGTLPAAFIMRRHGRRNGYVVGVGFGVASGLIAALGIMLASFWIFCAGTFLAGFYGAYVQSYRFAAADTAEDALKAKAISWVMVGGSRGCHHRAAVGDLHARCGSGHALRWQLPQPGAAAADRLADPADAAHAEPDPGRSSRR